MRSFTVICGQKSSIKVKWGQYLILTERPQIMLQKQAFDVIISKIIVLKRLKVKLGVKQLYAIECKKPFFLKKSDLSLNRSSNDYKKTYICVWKPNWDWESGEWAMWPWGALGRRLIEAVGNFVDHVTIAALFVCALFGYRSLHQPEFSARSAEFDGPKNLEPYSPHSAVQNLKIL